MTAGVSTRTTLQGGGQGGQQLWSVLESGAKEWEGIDLGRLFFNLFGLCSMKRGNKGGFGQGRAGGGGGSSSSSSSFVTTDRAANIDVRGKVSDVLPDHGSAKDGASFIDEESACRSVGGLLDTDVEKAVDKRSVQKTPSSTGLGVQPHHQHLQQDPGLTWACGVWGVLARLSPGDKLAFLGGSGGGGASNVDLDIDRAKILTPFKRAYRGDNRGALLTFVGDLVTQTIALASTVHLPPHFPDLVLGGIKGLEILRYTYAADARFLARFDASLASIRRLDEILEIETSLYLKL